MKIISVPDLSLLIQKHGILPFFKDLITYLRSDFSRWDEFEKCPRPAFHVPGGVLELMPIRDHEYFSYKYVNGHPSNPLSQKHTVVAVGQLSSVKTGYPLMISEMTFLTAFRTAATAALASDLLSNPQSKILSLIGTGAQAEFQVLAQTCVRNIEEVRYFDLDPQAMEKFAHNLKDYGLKLTPCASVEEATQSADIINTCTAKKAHVDVLKRAWVKPGAHINALGGDCPGKTEIELSLLHHSNIIVEYLPQTRIEGEIQRFSEKEIEENIYGELWEIVTGVKQGLPRNDITLFDCVGFAVEDFSALRLVYDLAHTYDMGQEIALLPPPSDPKNLFAAL